MTLNYAIQNKCCVVTVQGNIAGEYAARFQREMLQILMQQKGYTLILDFSNVKKIDATALGFLLFCIKKLEAQAQKISICGVNLKNQRLLAMSGLEQLLKTFPSVQQAMAQ